MAAGGWAVPCRRYIGLKDVHMKKLELSNVLKISDVPLAPPTGYLTGEHRRMFCQFTKIIKITFKTRDIIT